MRRMIAVLLLIVGPPGVARAVSPSCNAMPNLACLATDETWGSGSTHSWIFDSGANPDPSMIVTDLDIQFATPGGQVNLTRQLEIQGSDTGIGVGGLVLNWDLKTINATTPRAINLTGNPSNNGLIPQGLVVNWTLDGGGAGSAAQVFRSDIIQTRSDAGAIGVGIIFDDATVYRGSQSSGAVTTGTHQTVRSNPLCNHTGTGGTVVCGKQIGLSFQPRVTTTAAGGDATLTDGVGIFVDAPSLSGDGTEALTTITALDIADLIVTGVTNAFSIVSAGSGVIGKHAGPLTVGANASPDAEAVIDMRTNGNRDGFLPPRVTETDMPTCDSGGVGFVAHCTDCQANSCTSGSSTTNSEYCACVQTGASTYEYEVLSRPAGSGVPAYLVVSCGSGTCGTDPVYISPLEAEGLATETDADWVPQDAITIVAMSCKETGDTDCTRDYTLMKNGSVAGGGTPDCQIVALDQLTQGDDSSCNTAYNGTSDTLSVKGDNEQAGSLCGNTSRFSCLLEYN